MDHSGEALFRDLHFIRSSLEQVEAVGAGITRCCGAAESGRFEGGDDLRTRYYCIGFVGYSALDCAGGSGLAEHIRGATERHGKRYP